MLGLGLSYSNDDGGVGAGSAFQQESSNTISGQTDGGGLYYRDAPIGGTPGGDAVLTLVDGGGGASSRVNLNFVAVSGAVNWTPGGYTFNLNVKSKSDVLTLASVFLYRAGSPVQEWDPAVALAVGVNTIQLVASSTYSGAKSDLIYFQFFVTSTGAAIGHTFTITADQIITVPWAQDAVVASDDDDYAAWMAAA